MNSRRVIAAVALASMVAGCSDDDEAESGDSAAAVASVSTAEGCAALRDRLEDGLSTDPDRQDELAQVYEDAKAFAPDHIDDDLDILVAAYKAVAVAMEASEDRLHDDDVDAAMIALARPPVNTAIVTASAYFDEECPTES